MLIVIGLIGIKINHEVKLGKEEKILLAYGVGEQVSVHNKKINVYTAGKKEATKTIVYMHGLGIGDTTISARPMLKNFEEKYKVCIVDRYGNGNSEDSKEPQTVESIIDTYRSALQEAGQKAPYVLIAHSVSGIYATYWAQQYPEEVASIVYLDADPVQAYLEEGKPSTSMCLMSKVQNMMASMGLQRVMVPTSTLIGEDINGIYSEEENKLRAYLMYQNTYSHATESEMDLYYENAQTVSQGELKLNIPLLYIQASELEGNYYDKVYGERLAKRFKGEQDKIQAYIEKGNKQMMKKCAYMKGQGEVQIVQISGPHCLYEYAPVEVAQAILAFLQNE